MDPTAMLYLVQCGAANDECATTLSDPPGLRPDLGVSPERGVYKPPDLPSIPPAHTTTSGFGKTLE